MPRLALADHGGTIKPDARPIRDTYDALAEMDVEAINPLM
jgi:hypothetical protein